MTPDLDLPALRAVIAGVREKIPGLVLASRYWRGVSILAPDGARLTYTNGRLTHVNDWSLWS